MEKLTSNQAAKIAGLSRNTIKRYARLGWIRGHLNPTNKRWTFHSLELQEDLRKLNIYPNHETAQTQEVKT